MKEIIVTTQKEFDDLPEKFDEYTKIIIQNDPLVGRIVINKNCGNSSVVAHDNSSVMAWENSSVEAWGNSSVEAWGNSSVEAWGNSSVMAWGNSSVKAYENSSVMANGNSSVMANGNSSVKAFGNSSVKARENSSVVAHDNSSVVAHDNSSVMAWGNSSVVARGNSSVVAWGTSSVKAYENSSVEAWGNVAVWLRSKLATVELFNYSVCWNFTKGKNIKNKSKTARILRPKFATGTASWIDNYGLKPVKGYVILYKRVSSEFKTQENTDNETLWKIGTTLTHPNYNPSQSECGPGKYHACSRPYFCDEFRNEKGDKYVAIKVNIKDLFVWKKSIPEYPNKVAFKKGKVLYECDKFGNEN